MFSQKVLDNIKTVIVSRTNVGENQKTKRCLFYLQTNIDWTCKTQRASGQKILATTRNFGKANTIGYYVFN